MNSFNLTTFINSIANYISSQLDDKQLGLMSALLIQLGDTLNTILISRNN